MQASYYPYHKPPFAHDLKVSIMTLSYLWHENHIFLLMDARKRACWRSERPNVTPGNSSLTQKCDWRPLSAHCGRLSDGALTNELIDVCPGVGR